MNMYLNEYDVQGHVPVVVQLLIIGNVLWYYHNNYFLTFFWHFSRAFDFFDRW